MLVTRSTNASIDNYELHQYTISFVGKAVAGNVPQLRVVDLGDNGCGVVSNGTAGQEAGDTLVESFLPLYKVQNTADLAYNATAADMKAAIETLSGSCTVDVSRGIQGNGYEWVVTFSDPVNDRLLRPMRPNALLLDNTADYVDPVAVVVPLLRADISTPKSGVPYHVRVAAGNEVGVGAFRTSSPTSLQPAPQTPGGVTYAIVGPLSDTEILVQWEAPLFDGGEKISEYYLEWDTAATFDSGSDGNPIGSVKLDASEQESIADVQAVRVSIDDGLYVSGSFSLKYHGQTSGPIPFDASAEELKISLEGLCTIGEVAVSRSLGPANGGYTWLVTMIAEAEGGENGDGQMSTTSTLQTVTSHKLAADGENLLVCHDATRSGCWSDPDRTSVGVETRREVQRLRCQPAIDFSISFMGEITETLPSDANSTEIEQALEALYNIGDVTVTGSCDISEIESFVYVTFENDPGDLPELSSSVEGSFEQVHAGGVQVVVGRKPFSYTISDISGATPWAVRIFAYNRIGYSDFVVAEHDSTEVVLGVIGAPGRPENVAVEVNNAGSAWVYWDPPTSTGGDNITEYIVEVDTSDGFDSTCGDGPEVQTFTVSADNAITSGETFNLSIGGDQYATCIDWNTSDSVFPVQDALRSAGGALGNVVVTRGGDGSAAWAYGYTYSVTFVYNATDSALPDFQEMEVVSCGTGSDSVTFEVATLRDGTATETSACQVDNLRPMQSQHVLASEAEGAGETELGAHGYLLANLTPGVQYRARVSAVNSFARSPWTFMGFPGRPTVFAPVDVPKITRNVTVAAGTQEGNLHVGIGLPVGIDPHGVEGLPLEGFRIEISRRVNEVQVISVVFGSDASGTGATYPTQGAYTLTVGNATTWCLDWDASADEVELALDSLSTVDGVNVEALQPEKNSTSNGTTSIYSSEPLLVAFTGPQLSNGDQDLMDVGICTSLNAGAYFDVYTVTDGVAGSVSPVVTLSTLAIDDATITGHYVIAFGYRGELGLRLGEGDKTSVNVTVDAGSRTIRSSSDLSHYVNPGDRLKVGGVELTIAGDFTCEDRIAWDNTIEEYPCAFVTESPHPTGASGVPAYGMSNGLGSVHVESGSTQVLTDWDLTPYLMAGDGIVMRDPASGAYYHSVVTSVTSGSITLEAGYEGASAVRAAAFYSPYAVIPFDASAEELRDAVESLPSVGSAEVTRIGPDERFAYEWSVTLTSFDGPLAGADTLQVSSKTGKTLEVTNCGDGGNGTYVGTGEIVGGRMRYKLVDRPSYIEFDPSEDDGKGLWVVRADSAVEPYATAVLHLTDTAVRDSLLPPTGSASYWSGDCTVSFSTSPVELLGGGIVSTETTPGVKGGFETLAKDIFTGPGIPEVQSIQLGATSDALDGTFMIDFADAGGFTAAWDISAEDMEVSCILVSNASHSLM